MKQRKYQISTHKAVVDGLFFGAVWSESGLRLVHITTLQTSRDYARSKAKYWAEHSGDSAARSLELVR